MTNLVTRLNKLIAEAEAVSKDLMILDGVPQIDIVEASGQQEMKRRARQLHLRQRELIYFIRDNHAELLKELPT